ncbi:PAS domain-containing sensor histidine kinase [Pedobacter yulinensis]|uniref:Sensor protein FixL n=1 Tax=Pedobacter yulinensis TaxID=2126353 RepID=A0A2T3HK14_9SPHI|nr:PAS domain-containing sensor histidine kinase [Pedobacter yulinensis]PST82770.1 PAS domain-containing sensor histidine kinase [Pedobacter yulinensis]
MNKESLLTAIIETAIDGIITISDRGIVESINPAACRLFMYDETEVIGNNISMLMPSPDREQHDGYLSNYQRTGNAHIIGKGREVYGLRKDGSVFPFRLAVSKVQYSGRIIYTGFVHDLSREKEAEERLREYALNLEDQVNERTQSLKNTIRALEAAREEANQSLEKEKELNQLKTRFVSMASHEFRTPLSAVQLSAVLIERYAAQFENANIAKHLGKIKNSVQSLTSILNDFLSLERLETGRVEPEYASFDIVQFSEELTEEMQLLAKQNQHIIYQHTGTGSSVHLDPKILKYCVVNLVGNAIKYSGENTYIEYSTEIRDNRLELHVRDNGIGIPESDQKHLFEAFFRAHNTGSIPGTGLGLNIVTRYVALLKGSISFESKLNQGTSFTIILPLDS